MILLYLGLACALVVLVGMAALEVLDAKGRAPAWYSRIDQGCDGYSCGCRNDR